MTWALMAAALIFTACKKSDRDRPGIVEGEVVDVDTGLPIAGVTVCLNTCQRVGGDAFHCETTHEMKTGADGKYSLTFRGRRSKNFRLELVSSDSILPYTSYNIQPGQKTRIRLEAIRAFPAKVRLVIRKNEAPQLYCKNSILPPGPLDTTFSVWGPKNTDFILHLGAQDKTAGFVRGVRKIIPIFPGNSETTLIVIEDMLQLPKLQ
ncbi:peptidase associated/transthyretin-like domain-containing protein [Chitinophaga rhizosphaerae]|uniref:carboxypeptidase regulatory-like domain-containing protein n=1 Tax=Chitinophaga rhizosphaerae TaxID=1864947 RepID=UPI000F8068EC|nr:carboxypeptidase regulatory-like domain-containing protein [Chitinophaga rhizosphaerae]